MASNLSLAESAERIAEHFAKISQLYQPLDVSRLPKYVKDIIEDTIYPFELPILTEEEVWDKMEHAKKPKGGVPGDLPKKIIKEFSPELATPASTIFQNIINQQEWPSTWRTEYGIPLQKVKEPDNEDQLRIISLTPFLSKIMEKFVMEWLLFYIGDRIDWRQYGGQKGSSIAHYLIEFINFILYNQDLKEPQAVLAVMIDFSKAFNRQDHNILLTLLCDLGVPGWLLRIVASFLEDRELLLKYKGHTASSKKLPGGGPQGTVLGMFLFIVLINLIGFTNQEKEIGKMITKPLSKRKPMPSIHLKFIDDLSVAESLSLKKQLIPNPDTNQPRPLEFRNRTEHVLPESESKVQDLLDRIMEYTVTHKMKVNSDKSKVMLFNSSRKFDFKPTLSLDSGNELNFVESSKLLGIILQSNLKWNLNTDSICTNAYARIWMLRRLKLLGATEVELTDVYVKQVRCVVELAVAVWSAGLTKNQAAQIERVQKTVCAVILGDRHTDYKESLDTLDLKTLEERRQELCSKFALKSYRSDKYQHWFSNNNNNLPTRSVKTCVLPVSTRTRRFEKSPLPYLTTLLNDIQKQK